MEVQEASPRIPFRAASTPPASAPHLYTTPASYNPSTRASQDGYPESPVGLRPQATFQKPYIFTLGQLPTRRRRFRILGSPKRLFLIVFLAVLALLGRFWHASDKSKIAGLKDFDGLCRFVSPIDAYHRDLTRLRTVFRGSSFSRNSSIYHGRSKTFKHYHSYSPTGHLIVSHDPEAPHPIPLLLDLGEKRWEELLSRQSRTLEEAVREYIRRYGRQPPKGFDKWWDFAMQHNLVLPDEYDRINLDLAPFLALPKSEMMRRMEMVDNMAETFTLVVRNGSVDIEIKDEGGLQWGGTLPRARDTASLLRGFSDYLPDMRATFSIFDQPQIYLSWARRGSLVDLGLRGEKTSHLEETDSAKVKLSRSCAPDSNYRKNENFSEGKSLIYDSLEAGDLCQNPYLIPLHGLTIEPHEPYSHPRPHTQLLPLFSLAKTSINSDILVTPLDQFHDPPGNDPEWENKPSSKLAWRGSPTGISWMTSDLDWRSAHRFRLHNYANNRSLEPMNYLVPNLGQREEDDYDELDVYSAMGGDEDLDGWREGNTEVKEHRATETEGPLRYKEEKILTAQAMEFFYDIKLAGEPIQCSQDDGTCQSMWDEIEWAPRQSGDDLNLNKFLLDIDGNGWSGRFRKLMSTNSLVIKMTMFTEWFQPHLIPWFMYIPAKLDFSDLPDIMAFFRGTPTHPELAFDETAQALARNGKCFVQRMFRMEDLQAYMMRLFLEYARIAAKEGVDMDFHLNNDNWTQINSFERFSSPEDTLVDGGYSSHLTKMPLPDAKEEAPRHKAGVIMEEAKKDMDGMDGVKLEVWISGDDVAVDTTAGERK
ncbi:CAP1-related [Cryptococcus deneoformans JEC21]|uniref:CAP1-related n=1 Tax=Cryptococcus deneoformans (strain JEC21 / ATCC MYA-565) TaxID=214684 RepID=Q5KI68_CRYD1|nr:CAP1-related [Cryptococcus neoformans var. neoformans JEC21]AAW42848.2 CAP1-related [Cryptococcus neoformans var. neoformans JEC21]